MVLVNDVIYSCGLNSNGELGIGGGGNKNIFTMANSTYYFINENIKDISAGTYCSLLLKNGVVYSCGSNHYGQLGIGNNSGTNIFMKVSDTEIFTNNNVIAISLSSHSLVLRPTEIRKIKYVKKIQYNK